MDEVTGGWRKLHNEELQSLYSSPHCFRVIKSRRMRWARHVVCMGEMRNSYEILAGKPEEKPPLRRPRCKWEYNIKVDHREIGFEGVNWIHLAQDRDQLQAHVNMVMNLQDP
jgi:hypothetical protein